MEFQHQSNYKVPIPRYITKTQWLSVAQWLIQTIIGCIESDFAVAVSDNLLRIL